MDSCGGNIMGHNKSKVPQPVSRRALWHITINTNVILKYDHILKILQGYYAVGSSKVKLFT
jgi:hypothetical protein